MPVAIVAGEYLGPPLTRLARIHKAVERNGEISLAGRSGAWVRDGNLILRAAGASDGGRVACRYSRSLPETAWQSVGRGGNHPRAGRAPWELGDYA